MATGKASDFQIYNEQMMGGFIETEVQFSAAFNQASAGAIVNVPNAHKGDYIQESYYKNIDSLISRRDTTSVSAATALKLEQGELDQVKLNRTIGPIDQTLDAFKKIQASAGENGQASLDFLLGSQIAKSMQVERLNTALRCVVAAMTADAANVEADDAGTVTTAGLTQALEKMGDAADKVVAWVMHSATYFALVREQLASTASVFTGANTVINAASPVTLGRPVVVTDSSLLTNDDSPTGKYVLGLTAGAVTTADSEPSDVVRDLITGLDSLVVRLQGEFAYTVGIRGYAYDTANGGANPTNGVIGTSTNWDKQVASHKDGPGVRLTVE